MPLEERDFPANSSKLPFKLVGSSVAKRYLGYLEHATISPSFVPFLTMTTSSFLLPIQNHVHLVRTKNPLPFGAIFLGSVPHRLSHIL